MTHLMTNLFFQNMGIGEWIPIILILLLLFGGKKIPELMKGLGKGVKEFKDAKDGKSDSLPDSNDNK